MRRLTGMLFSWPHNGGAHGAPAPGENIRRGAIGARQATDPGSGAEPHAE
jgi:hypothetical protein